MARHHLESRWLESTRWTAWDGSGNEVAAGGVTIESNQDYSCFSIRSTEPDQEGDDDLIHFCDWRELVKAITEFMTEREKIAHEDGDCRPCQQCGTT